MEEEIFPAHIASAMSLSMMIGIFFYWLVLG
jgi:hypothetical protein